MLATPRVQETRVPFLETLHLLLIPISFPRVTLSCRERANDGGGQVTPAEY